MTNQSFSLPFIPAKNKHSLLLAMRDYYENIGQYLPNKKLERTPIAQFNYGKKMPQSISYNEIKLWQVDQEDHSFRAQFFSDLPDFLAGYFADKYINIFQVEGRKEANSFLRQTLGGNIQVRISQVKARYQVGTPSTLSINFADEFARLVTLSTKKLEKLSIDIVNYLNKHIQTCLADQSFCLTANHIENNSLEKKLYRTVLKELIGINIIPPYFNDFKNNKLTNDNCIKALAKITNHEWWQRKLKTRRDFEHEHFAIAVGQVQKKASPYASRSCQMQWQEQKRRNQKYLEKMAIENQETGEQLPLELQVYKSVANPAIRRVELMTRMRGFEDLADQLGYQGAFITLTAPAKYHSTHAKGGFVENWQGNTPRETQAYLCKVWSRIRAKLNRENIQFFGFRVAEPHHDGTPHWHILIFMRPEDIQKAFYSMWIYAMDEDGDEKGAAINRFEFKDIDKQKGSATGYIAKYIAKNIDGYALENEIDTQTGENLKLSSKAITAWASRWKIRQFQQLGGAPVSVWRELRRLKNKKVTNDIIDPVLASADIGDWAAYTTHQGGPLVKRKDIKVRLAYEDKVNQYEEIIKKIKGVYAPIHGFASFICTRLIKWKLVPKNSSNDVKTNDRFLLRAERTPWSSVNNCTHINYSKQQRQEIKQQLKIIGLPDNDLNVNQLYLRRSIRLNAHQHLILTDSLNGFHLIVNNHYIEPKKRPSKNYISAKFY